MTFDAYCMNLEALAMERISHLVDRAHHLEFIEHEVRTSQLLLEEAKDLATAMDDMEDIFFVRYWRTMSDSEGAVFDLFHCDSELSFGGF